MCSPRVVAGAFAALLVLAATLAMPSGAHACSCRPARPACEAVWASDAVFAGEVLAVVTEAPDQSDHWSGKRRVRLREIETWRGDIPNVVDVYTGLGDHDCGYVFDQGGTYLVYAARRAADGQLITHICTRTKAWRDAAEDRAYLSSVAQAGPPTSEGGRVYGQVLQLSADGLGERHVLLVARTIRIWHDAGATEVTTDHEGRYEASGVPAGTVVVELVRADGADGPTASGELRDRRGCTVIDLRVDGPPQG